MASRVRAGSPTLLRCAIYTRKSTEDGLEQEFNSLDAQREACAAYILSQRHEGWTLLPDIYDDGGFSGGNMDRPGLKELLGEVKAGRVDVIVVYKVDRLTRSLADFAKIVEILDEAGASFVSVTQAFNTTSSMGRLTLNVLLSFAQFEREVTGERIRDKIAASKKKGMWMGGGTPLGYEVVDRKLLVDKSDAETVRFFFRRYLELGTVQALKDELAARGIVSKRRISRAGRERGGCMFTAGALAHLLKNRIYVGEVQHHGKWFPGEHDAIISAPTFERVQVQLKQNSVDRKHRKNVRDPGLLSGLIFDTHGRRMGVKASRKGDIRYRYYRTDRDAEPTDQPLMSIPGGELDAALVDQLGIWLDDPSTLDALAKLTAEQDCSLSELRARIASVRRRLVDGLPSEKRAVVLDLVSRVDLRGDRLDIRVRFGPSLASLQTLEDQCREEVLLSVAAMTVRAANEVRLVIAPTARTDIERQDPALIGLVVKAQMARELLLGSPGASLDELVERFGVTRDYYRVLIRLSFLAPDIVEAILGGKQHGALSRQRLARLADLPLDWSEQRKALGGA